MNVDKETVTRLNDHRDEQLGSSTSKLPLSYQPIKFWPNWDRNLSILEDGHTF